MTDSAADTAASPTAASDPADAVFTLWAVFRRDPAADPEPLDPAAGDELADALDGLGARGVTVRGLYDVSGFRADADLMVWLHGPDPAALQSALRALRRTALLSALLPHWNFLAVHREAEFNKRHVPAFVRGVPPKEWIAVYPFVRSHEWYLVRDAERSRMLAEHGRAGAAYEGVLTNTVAAFALGDYEWIVPIESDDLARLTDMMRALRYVDARLHVTLETPFFTGRRITASEALEVVR